MDDEMKAAITMKIGALMELVKDADSLLAILATCIHIWAEDHGEDVTALAACLTDAVITANGLEIEGDMDE